jgi:hypothetical protein
MKDDSPFVFASLWEGWQNPETQQWLRTCTIITGQPNELVAEIHTRMPVILPLETHEPCAIHRDRMVVVVRRYRWRVAGYEFCVFVNPPPQESCLSQLLVFGPLGERYFTH